MPTNTWKPNRLETLLLLTVPLVFMLVGGAIAYTGFHQVFEAWQSPHWPQAPGRVIFSQVTSFTGSSSSTTSYRAKIAYEFTVDGRTIQGHRVAYGVWGSSRSSYAEDIVARYPEGRNVTAYYMPSNADVCVLEPGLHTNTVLLPIAGMIFFGPGCLFFIFLCKGLRKDPAISTSKK